MEPLRPKDARRHGLSRTALYRAARAGQLHRVARGLYVPADSSTADWDWIEAAARRPDATICLASALAYHDLVDTIPNALDVAIPRGARIPVTRSTINWHVFAHSTFAVGRTQITIPGSQVRIGMYSAERSIVDAFRLRGRQGYELGPQALREWLRRGGKPADMVAVAVQLPRSKGQVLSALELLQ